MVWVRAEVLLSWRLVGFGCLAMLLLVLAGRAAAAEATGSDTATEHAAPACVALLHGLARTRTSMNKLAAVLRSAGYRVVNIGYPSRDLPVETLAAYVGVALVRCRAEGATPVHFVTHSLGGILLRVYFASRKPVDAGRVVMLAPPNHGSELVDRLRDFPGFRYYNGPAGQQLGTGSDDLPAVLGPIRLETAVIGGTRSFNPLFSHWLPDTDDGKVSIGSTRLDGMCAHLALPVTHTFIMRDDTVIAEVLNYLRIGRFVHPDAEHFACPGRDDSG